MDYFYYERLPELSPYPRHPHRQYRSMFLTSDDNSLLQPHSGDYGLPRSGSEDEASEMGQVAPANQECRENEFDNVVETSEINVITTASATTISNATATATVASEHQQAHYIGTMGTEMCEQHILCVNYSPHQEPPQWPNEMTPSTAAAVQRTAAEAVVATSYDDQLRRRRPCPGCECELKIDQYISELLIENLNNNDHSGANGTENQEPQPLLPASEERPPPPQNGEGDGQGRPPNEIGYEENVNERQPRPNNNKAATAAGGEKEVGGKNNSGNRDEDVVCDNVVPGAAPVGDRMGVDNERAAEEEEGSSTDRLTYIPCYTNDRNEIILGPVSSGSVYPDVDFENAILVPRLSAYPRSDSMEVRSSASADRNPPLDSEENLSLVDSLDGSSLLTGGRQREESLEREIEEDQARKLQRAKSIENATTQNIEKPEAFFVPIGRTSYQEDLNIAKKMPAQIREKLNLRQRRRNFKREQELVRKNNNQHHHHVQKTVIETRLVNRVADMRIDNSSAAGQPPNAPQRQMKKFFKSSTTTSSAPSHTMFITKYHPAVIPLSPPTLSSDSRHRKVGLRGVKSDIGSLKSYTIDSKGNMQFQAPPTKGHPPKIATRRATTVTTKMRKKCSSTEAHHYPGRLRKKTECMTLYQTMNLTPDSETGPRRIYQKTEIQDGEKRIEILEIVECAGSSSNSNNSLGRNSSRIPRPISKLPKHFQSFPNTAATTTSSSSGGGGGRGNEEIATLDRQDSNDSDQSIADLLIENLKNNTRVPDAVGQQQSRRPVTGPKFTQMFEVIPEEKSNASHDSTADEKSSVDSGKGGRGNKNSNGGGGALRKEKEKAFTVLNDRSEGNGNPNGPDQRRRSEEGGGGGGWGPKESLKHPKIGNNVVKKGNRQSNGEGGGGGVREHLPKAKQLRGTTSTTANATDTPSTGEAATPNSVVEKSKGERSPDGEQTSFIPTTRTEAQETQSNYNTTHSAGTLIAAAT